MAQLLTFMAPDVDISQLKGSGIVVKNTTGGPFSLDSDGTLLHSNQIVMASQTTSVIEDGLKDGALVILKSFNQEKASQKKEEVPQTVATSSEKTSVQ